MWHEARKQEKKIRGLMVDFKRRADRRREFYEKIVSARFLYQLKPCVYIAQKIFFLIENS